jgi:endonuclease/exonuclease/phosphatase family metal-dependent hydrolase
MRVKALTYNLYWWNLYGQRNGNSNSAGRLVQGATGNEKFDVIGFQECDDPNWIMSGAGLSQDEYDYVRYGSNTLAWRTTRWEKLSDGIERTCEDRADQYYGRRGVQWVRLRERAGQGVLFFMNHHGCLPVNSGGQCGGRATAHNTAMAIAKNAVEGDALLIVGDFNNDAGSSMIRTLEDKIHRIYGDWVDQVFSSCAGQNHVVETRNLGKGGSDHNAGMVIVNF